MKALAIDDDNEIVTHLMKTNNLYQRDLALWLFLLNSTPFLIAQEQLVLYSGLRINRQ